MVEKKEFGTKLYFNQQFRNLAALLSAAYLFHICQNHPFIDGNKRVATVSSLMFLIMNDYSIDYNENDLEKMTRSVAAGKTKKNEIALFLSKALG
jgi:death-on-curing protein